MFKRSRKTMTAIVVAASLAAGCVSFTTGSKAVNPYMPMWEHIPDGEPYVFEDPDNPGTYRLYVYGSHDTRLTDYCGYDFVVWSAPLDNLNDFKAGYGLKDIYNKMYTPITISYSKELRKFVYRVSDERNYSVATKNGNKLRFNLFELKIKAQ